VADRRLFPVVACLAVLAVSPAAAADPLLLTIQPIQVCDDLGIVCANPGRTLFGSITRAIWQQANIMVTALGWQTIASSALLDATFPELAQERPQVPGVLNVWFVDQVLGCGGVAVVFGCAFVGGNGIAVAASAVEDRRADILAHELGHNLGLGHVSDPLNLMAFGETRIVPAGLADIYPFGGLGRLDAEQIRIARDSPHLTPVPEPGSLALVLAGLGGILARAGVRARRPRGGERGAALVERSGRPRGDCRFRPRACGRPPSGREPEG